MSCPSDLEKKECCVVCGGLRFQQIPVLWPDLIAEWELKEHEVLYINEQQGKSCSQCGSSTRIRALAAALISSHGGVAPFRDFLGSPRMYGKKILEINTAGNLHELLKHHPDHTLAEFPEYDMMNLRLPSESFDIVIHSDTLEHVPDPIRGLQECHRVLASGGKCFYTIPVIVDRPTRHRGKMSKSFHGSSDCRSDDYLVHSEFGCDHWKIAFEAGFKTLKIYAQNYPAGMAYEAGK